MSTTELAPSQPEIGCSKDDLDTPVLCLDADALEKNIAAMAATCRENGVDWRPHTKCHKSPIIGQKLLEAGAIGLTCAKLGEAEVMAAGGIRDILIANLIVGKQKLSRLAELCRHADPIVCIDHIDQAGPMSEAIEQAGLRVRVMLEVDIGLERAGVALGEASVELARQVSDLPGLELVGLMGYEGHLLTIEDQQEKAEKIKAALDALVETKRMCEEAGMPCPIISCGGTGSYRFTVLHDGVTEVQAGGAIFMDEFYLNICKAPPLDFAMFILATVVSRPAPDRALIDAGRKTMNMDLQTPRVLNRPGVTVDRLSAEHGALTLAPEAQDLKIGDRIEMIPGYSDMTAVLHNDFYVMRNDRLEAIWPLTGRGRLQ